MNLEDNKDFPDGEEGELKKAQHCYQPRAPNVVDPALSIVVHGIRFRNITTDILKCSVKYENVRDTDDGGKQEEKLSDVCGQKRGTLRSSAVGCV